MLPTCSIVIRTLNEARHLGEVLAAIAAQEYPAPCREVVVVDSGSTDDTLAIATRHGCRIVPIRRSEFSFGRSLNYGCEVARGEFLVFVSGHCVPIDSQWLWRLVLPFRDERVAIAYGRQEGGADTRFSENGLFGKYFPKEREGGHQAPFFCNNANLAIRRSAWEHHRYDETLTGLEDMHLARRLWSEGARIAYVPDSSVIHYHHETWRQVMRRYEREAIALQRIMPEIHVQWHDALRYFIAGVMADSARALAQRCFWARVAEIMAFRYCQYAGAWKGNRIHRHLSRIEKEKYFYPN